MLRVAQSARVHAHSVAFRRSLASSVLLTRTWSNETVAQLRRETKSRGLSSTGTKAVLVRRLTDFEDKSGNARKPAGTRAASSAHYPVDTANIFNIQLPELYQPVAQLEAQVPYVPDFWDSSNNACEPVLEGSVPKLLVLAGVDTHHGGGASQELQTETSVETVVESPQQTPTSASSQNGGLLYDLAQDLGFLTQVPAAKPARTPFWQLFA